MGPGLSSMVSRLSSIRKYVRPTDWRTIEDRSIEGFRIEDAVEFSMILAHKLEDRRYQHTLGELIAQARCSPNEWTPLPEFTFGVKPNSSKLQGLKSSRQSSQGHRRYLIKWAAGFGSLSDLNLANITPGLFRSETTNSLGIQHSIACLRRFTSLPSIGCTARRLLSKKVVGEQRRCEAFSDDWGGALVQSAFIKRVGDRSAWRGRSWESIDVLAVFGDRMTLCSSKRDDARSSERKRPRHK